MWSFNSIMPVKIIDFVFTNNCILVNTCSTVQDIASTTSMAYNS